MPFSEIDILGVNATKYNNKRPSKHDYNQQYTSAIQIMPQIENSYFYI